MPQLRVSGDNDNFLVHEWTEDCVKVGRASDNDIVVDQESVSNHHAEIHSKSGSFYLHDLNSANGSRVNWEQIMETNIKSGDIIHFGLVEFVFISESIPDVAKKSLISAHVRADIVKLSKVCILVSVKCIRWIVAVIKRQTLLFYAKANIWLIKHVSLPLVYQDIGRIVYEMQLEPESFNSEFAIMNRLQEAIRSKKLADATRNTADKVQNAKSFIDKLKSAWETLLIKRQLNQCSRNIGGRFDQQTDNNQLNYYLNASRFLKASLCRLELNFVEHRLSIAGKIETIEFSKFCIAIKTLIERSLESFCIFCVGHWKYTATVLSMLVVIAGISAISFKKHLPITTEFPRSGKNNTSIQASNDSNVKATSPHRIFSDTEITDAIALMNLGGGKAELDVLEHVAADGTQFYPSDTVANVEFCLSKIYAERKDYVKARTLMKMALRDGNEDTKEDARKILRLLDLHDEMAGRYSINQGKEPLGQYEEPETSDLRACSQYI